MDLADLKNKLNRPVTLWGMMGAGKTKTGRHMASLLNLSFLDSDIEIEKAAGMTIPEIFEKYGEAWFRCGEEKVIRRLLADENPCIIALGGGAVMSTATQALLSRKALNIWLRADVDILVERVRQSTHRPLLNTDDMAEKLARLTRERTPIYEKADIIVDVDNLKQASEFALNVLEALQSHLDNMT